MNAPIKNERPNHAAEFFAAYSQGYLTAIYRDGTKNPYKDKTKPFDAWNKGLDRGTKNASIILFKKTIDHDNR